MKKVTAMIHSIQGQDEAYIMRETGPNEVTALYGNKVCTAVRNDFVGLYYVDDIYGVREELTRPERGGLRVTEITLEAIQLVTAEITRSEIYPLSNGGKVLVLPLEDRHSARPIPSAKENSLKQYLNERLIPWKYQADFRSILIYTNETEKNDDADT